MKVSYDYEELLNIIEMMYKHNDELVKVERGESIYGEHFLTKEKYSYAPIINFTVDDKNDWYFKGNVDDERIQTITWKEFREELNYINEIL